MYMHEAIENNAKMLVWSRCSFTVPLLTVSSSELGRYERVQVLHFLLLIPGSGLLGASEVAGFGVLFNSFMVVS